jgi:DNA-binding MarR family transcriptional regulator
MKDKKIKNIMKQVIIFNDIYEEVIQNSFKKNQNANVSKLEFNLLHTVYRHNELTISEVSDLLNISLPNCSRYVKNAIQEGYLNKRVDSGDKRIYYISLSDKGRSIVETTLDDFSMDISTHLNSLDPKDLDRLDESFSNLNSTLADTLLSNTNLTRRN